jgi:hypothetical protein
MITTTINSRKNGEIVASKKYTFRSTWGDLTLKHFMAYMAIVNRRDAYLKTIEDGINEQPKEDQELENDVFSVDMLVVLTGLPKQILYSMNSSAILELNALLEFTPDKLPKESDTLTEFWFRSATEKKIAIWEADYKKQSSLWSPKKKARTLAELTLMKKCRFTLKSKIDDMEFEKYIASNKVLKQIKKIQEQMNNQDFSQYAQLIAYIVDKNNAPVDIKTAQNLGLVFEDLPFITAYKIVNFFLNVRSVLSNNTKQYLGMMMTRMRDSRKLTKKEI